MSVRQPAELQRARVDTLAQDNERLRLELAHLTDELARRGGDCSAGIIVPGGVVVGSLDGKPIERGAAPDINAPGPNLANKADEKGPKGPGEKDANKDQGKGPAPQDKQADRKSVV